MIGHLPEQPNHPYLQVPRFDNHNMFPGHIQIAPIPKVDFRYENLRPSHLEIPAIDKTPMVKEQILPRHAPRTIEGFGRIAPDPLPMRPTFGSTIFLPALPPGRSLRDRDKMNLGAMAVPHQRRALGW